MTAERRSGVRCPSCQGPAVIDQAFPESIRCRNSSCHHNHQDKVCPRCGAKSISSAVWRNDQWHYTCGDCENKWAK